jgi:hypothetical protein
VCLEHGKPDPKPRVPYQIVPLEQVTKQPEVAELLFALGTNPDRQRIAQIAAWHLANGMTWQQLDALTITHLNGRRERWFHPAQIEAARKLVERLPSTKAKKHRDKPSSESLSQR